MLSLYRRLLALRREHPALVRGTIENVAAQGDVLTYERRDGDRQLLIALNMGGEEATVRTRAGVVLLSTLAGGDGRVLDDGDHRLAAGEGIVVEI